MTSRRPFQAPGRPANVRSQRIAIAEADVLRRIVQRRLGTLVREPLDIQSHDLDLAIGRDVVDLMLRLHRRDWIWTDAGGRYERPNPVHRAVARLALEAGWSIPAAYVRHRRKVAHLERTVRPQPQTETLERALFIRSDHSFGVVAGGSVGHLAGVIRGFRNLGLDVQVASSDILADVPSDDDFHVIRPEYRSIRNFSELIRLEYNNQLMAGIEARWRDWNPDFVYHRYSVFNYAGPALRARYGIPYVCEFNGPLAWVQRHWDDRPLLLEGMAERIERLNLANADLVVVVSEALVGEAVRRGADPRRILVNPNGVDPARYTPEISGLHVRRRYRLEDALVVGFIGTIGPWHGVEKLIEAAAILAADHGCNDSRPLRFLIIGDGTRMPVVRQMVRDADLEDRFTFTGLIPQSDGPAYLAACDILASPHVPNPDGTEFFGSPTKLFEYMAMGRAIVASELGQIADVIDHDVTGLLVPPADAAAVAAAIRRLRTDAALRARLGADAREAAVRKYSWDAHTRRIVDALRTQVSTTAGGKVATCAS